MELDKSKIRFFALLFFSFLTFLKKIPRNFFLFSRCRHYRVLNLTLVASSFLCENDVEPVCKLVNADRC